MEITYDSEPPVYTSTTWINMSKYDIVTNKQNNFLMGKTEKQACHPYVVCMRLSIVCLTCALPLALIQNSINSIRKWNVVLWFFFYYILYIFLWLFHWTRMTSCPGQPHHWKTFSNHFSGIVTLHHSFSYIFLILWQLIGSWNGYCVTVKGRQCFTFFFQYFSWRKTVFEI